MKTFLLNYWRMLRQFKTAAVLNLLGLSIAFATFLVMMMQVTFEKSFDHCHSKLSMIYKVELTTPSGYSQTVFSRPLVNEIIKSSALIESGTIINPYISNLYFSVTNGENKMGFKEDVVSCYPGITNIFDFDMLEGSSSSLNEPGSVLIPQSIAKKMFGDASAINQRINLESPVWTVQDDGFLTVGGVYRDFPENTQLNNVIYAGMANDYTLTDWQSNNYFCYLLLAPGANPYDVGKAFVANFDFTKIGYDTKPEAHLIPFGDLYFMNDTSAGLVKAGNPVTVTVLLLIAILIIVVAAINFTNFSTALTPLRLKNINIRKVLGSSVRSLRISMVLEAMTTAFVAYLLALLIVSILADIKIMSFISADISLVSNLPLVFITAGVALVIGAIAGLYPSYYITSFPPALVLKGSFGLSPTGRKLRAALLGFQFVVSLMLIIGALFIYLQNRYMRNFNLGFDKDQIAVVELDWKFIRPYKDAYVEKLKSNPSIADVAFAGQKIGSTDSYMGWGGKFKENNVQLTVIPVSWNFIDVMGIRQTGGNKLTQNDETGAPKMIAFESLRKQQDMHPGELMNIPWMKDGGNIPIVAFIDDVKMGSLRGVIDNGVFVVNYQKTLPVSFIRINKGADYKEVANYIRKTISDIDPAYPTEVEFYDTFFNNLYQEEERVSAIIYIFSILAIIISLVGVFGLVIFEAQYRRKEIGIRKVMGSSVSSILLMLSKRYIYLVLISFVVAVPVAWYAISNWLERFSYKVPLYWWVFAIALLIVMLITLATVVVQSWRAANANPRESITSE